MASELVVVVETVPRSDLLSGLHSTMPFGELELEPRELVRRSSVTLSEREINISAFIRWCEEAEVVLGPPPAVFESAFGELGLVVVTSFSEEEEVEERRRPPISG